MLCGIYDVPSKCACCDSYYSVNQEKGTHTHTRTHTPPRAHMHSAQPVITDALMWSLGGTEASYYCCFMTTFTLSPFGFPSLRWSCLARLSASIPPFFISKTHMYSSGCCNGMPVCFRSVNRFGTRPPGPKGGDGNICSRGGGDGGRFGPLTAKFWISLFQNFAVCSQSSQHYLFISFEWRFWFFLSHSLCIRILKAYLWFNLSFTNMSSFLPLNPFPPSATFLFYFHNWQSPDLFNRRLYRNLLFYWLRLSKLKWLNIQHVLSGRRLLYGARSCHRDISVRVKLKHLRSRMFRKSTLCLHEKLIRGDRVP